MIPAYKHLIQHAIANGVLVSVYDGEEWVVKRSSNPNEIIEAIESVDEAPINLRDLSGKGIGSALVSAFGLEPDETVIDHNDNSFMKVWWDIYSAAYDL